MMSINEESNADASSIGGQVANEMLLIQRYRRLEFNVVAALCNAVQEPGEIILVCIQIIFSKALYNVPMCVALFTGFVLNSFLVRNANRRDFHRKLKKGEVIRPPHIYDIVKVLTQDMSQCSADEPATNPAEMCVFMGGFPSEAEEFLRMSPKFFFVICDILGAPEVDDDPPQRWRSRRRTQLVVPVIFRGGHYYIIFGQENIPVHRVRHPVQFFFSPEGRSLLLHMLTLFHCHQKGDALELLFTHEEKLSLYSIPKVSNCGYPSEAWNNLTEDEIELSIPFNLEHNSSDPNNRNFFVQLVRLNDSNNIVDINFPQRS